MNGPKATAIIGEAKVLDLDALLSGRNNPPKVNPPKNGTLNVLRPERAAFNNALALMQKASTSNGSGKIIQQASTAITITTTKKQPRIQWKDRLCFSGEYIFYRDLKVVEREYDAGIQFKCTFPGCSKRLSTNVNFIYHTWAHIKNAHLKMTTRDGALFDLAFGISNNSMLMEKRTLNSNVYCPECMADFSSLHKMYTHLHYVHRLNATRNDRPICRICEKEIDPANASRHADNHPETDLPFVCQCCSYRCNSRSAFLIHFERHHNNGTTLVCPFCLEKFSVKRPSKVEGKRGLVTAHHFVEHVLDHFRTFTKKMSCYRCNIKLCATTHKELEEKLDEHSEWHRSVKLKVERKSLQDLYENSPNQRTADVRALPPLCYDCGYLIKSMDSHYRKKQQCKNEGCSFDTRCEKSFKQHEMLCPTKGASRVPFGWASLSGVKLNSLTNEKTRLKSNETKTPDQTLLFPKKRKANEEYSREMDLFALEPCIKHFKEEKEEEEGDSNIFEKARQEKEAGFLSKIIPFLPDKNLSVLKDEKFIRTISLMDNSNPSATNSFFTMTQFLCEEDASEAAKIGQKMFPLARYPNRKL